MNYCGDCLERADHDLNRLINGEIAIWQLPYDIRAWVLFGMLVARNG